MPDLALISDPTLNQQIQYIVLNKTCFGNIISTYSQSADTNKILVPTFVSPVKKPTFGSELRKKVILLEDIYIQDGLTVVGDVRINVSLLKALQTGEQVWSVVAFVPIKFLSAAIICFLFLQRKMGQKITVQAVYSTDKWETRSESVGLLVRARKLPHKLDDAISTSCFRFVIDCTDMDIGETLEFTLWCMDKESKVVTFEDDNGKRLYSISCVPAAKKNPWAAKAVRQLSAFAPVVKFNKNL